MSDENDPKPDESAQNNKQPGKVSETIDSITQLTKAVPIYQDAIQPVAKETGKALGTIGKAVNVALSPISAVVWGYEKISIFLEEKVAEKLEHVPEERITTPPPNVAGPAIEALKFTGQDETLSEMFANLIANSLDSKTAMEAHPSFVDIIKNMSADEGLILRLFVGGSTKYPLVDVKLQSKTDRGFQFLKRNFSTLGNRAGCKHRQLTANYIDNLCRLGLLEIPAGHLLDDAQYKSLEAHPENALLVQQMSNNESHKVEFDKKYIQTTNLGQQFLRSCVVDKRVLTAKTL